MRDNFNHASATSNKQSTNACPVDSFASMTAGELAEALEATLHEMTFDTYDEGLIDAYLDALDEKSPMPELPDEREAYQQLQDRIHTAFHEVPTAVRDGAQVEPPQRRRGRKRLRHMAVIAATLAICIFAGLFAAQAAGFHLMDAIAHWSQETFGFSYGSGPMETSGMPAAADSIFSELRQTLTLHGITDFPLPHYEPDGYTQSELYAEADGSAFYAVYQNGTDRFVVSISRLDSTAKNQAQKNNGSPERYTSNGTDYYISRNTGQYDAAWVSGEYEGSISNVASRDLLLKLLDSIE